MSTGELIDKAIDDGDPELALHVATDMRIKFGSDYLHRLNRIVRKRGHDLGRWLELVAEGAKRKTATTQTKKSIFG